MRGAFGVLGAVLAFTLIAGCAPGPKSGSTPGQGKPSTSDTVSAVEQRLRAEPALAGADIKVSEQGGTLMLDGTVKDTAAKDRAEKIALDLQKEKGLQTGVLNNLMVGASDAAPGGNDGGSTP